MPAASARGGSAEGERRTAEVRSPRASPATPLPAAHAAQSCSSKCCLLHCPLHVSHSADIPSTAVSSDSCQRPHSARRSLLASPAPDAGSSAPHQPPPAAPPPPRRSPATPTTDATKHSPTDADDPRRRLTTDTRPDIRPDRQSRIDEIARSFMPRTCPERSPVDTEQLLVECPSDDMSAPGMKIDGRCQALVLDNVCVKQAREERGWACFAVARLGHRFRALCCASAAPEQRKRGYSCSGSVGGGGRRPSLRGQRL